MLCLYLRHFDHRVIRDPFFFKYMTQKRNSTATLTVGELWSSFLFSPSEPICQHFLAFYASYAAQCHTHSTHTQRMAAKGTFTFNVNEIEIAFDVVWYILFTLFYIVTIVRSVTIQMWFLNFYLDGRFDLTATQNDDKITSNVKFVNATINLC